MIDPRAAFMLFLTQSKTIRRVCFLRFLRRASNRREVTIEPSLPDFGLKLHSFIYLIDFWSEIDSFHLRKTANQVRACFGRLFFFVLSHMAQAFFIILAALCFLSVCSAQNDCAVATWPKWSTLFGDPAAGATITINEMVLFDKSTTNVLAAVNISPTGGLYFDPSWVPSAGEPSLILRTKTITVPAGAKFVVGCASAVWTQPAEIILYGKRSEYTSTVIQANPGVKNIIVSGGLFQIQGTFLFAKIAIS